MLVRVAIAFILFVVMTAFKTYPLIAHVNTHIPSDLGDPLLNAWILAWDFHALATNPGSLFNANIFYPVENTLAFSEHLLGVLPIFAPAYAMTGNPIFAYNVAFFVSFVLSGVSMFLLIHYWTKSFWASLVSGVLFAFAPIRFAQMSHVQLLNFYWAPLTLLYLDKFLRGKRWKHLVCLGIFYWLQVLCSVYLAWFTTIAIALYTMYFVRVINRDFLDRSAAVKLTTFAASSVLVLLPFFFPYYVANQRWGFSRSISECASFSADLLLSYLTVPPLMNDLYRSLFRFAWELGRPHERWLFPGLVLPLLIALGSVPMKGSLLSDRLKQVKRVFWLLLISSFVLSLGPYLVVLKTITSLPLPYVILYYGIPGFKSMRVPARFDLMVVLAASVLAAVGFLRACSVLDGRLRLGRPGSTTTHGALAVTILGLFALELGFKPLPLAKIETGDDVPEVYRWLGMNTINGPIAELPIGQFESFKYMYYSTYHWLPLVNGTSGFVPPTYFQITSELNDLPSRKGVEYLGTIGVKGLIVHTGKLSAEKAARWRGPDILDFGLVRVAEFGPDVAYKIPQANSTHQLALTFGGPSVVTLGSMARLELLAQGEGHRAWTHPRPLGLTSAIIEWKVQGTGEASIRKERVGFPLAIRAGEVSRIMLPVGTPPSPGRYSLIVHFPSLDISTVPTVVELTAAPLPTSLGSPRLLSATYVLHAAPPSSISSEPIGLSLTATNTGKAVWLARAEGDRGTVRLAWRWFKGEREVRPAAGQAQLTRDVHPGQSHDFKVKIAPPKDPEDYILELGLVSEHVTWFFDQGVKPLRYQLRVLPARVPAARTRDQ